MSNGTHKLVLLRHGQSEWNRENRFTGWTDIDLSATGLEEAQVAGQILRARGFEFDVAFTSVLKRAIRTLWVVLDTMDQMWIPIHSCWRLNERHYGALQGLDKAETAARFGAEQVRLWRRSFDVRPPDLDPADARFPGHDTRYRHLRPDQLPLAESLKDTSMRLWPCWQKEISAALRKNETVLVVAHGNSLRAMIKCLDQIPDEEIAGVEIPTGVPLFYELDGSLQPVSKKYLHFERELQPA